ncbi:MAG: histidine--tRNA ligase [Oscillospiraceae bacterium]|jgi:histidyl-tRNA synthetase|nr:histidine--tRNA ligase [Oscillospiraceae bacterium]
MRSIIKAQRGVRDILPKDSYKWRFIEDVARNLSASFGFKEIRTPVFESTELFERSVGDETDVVQKEMYTFLDKGKRSITLRPEGTAGVVRSVIENSVFGGALPLKLFYINSFYRYEKPQAGRYREFYQFGAEVFGPESPQADAEVILFISSFFDELGIKNLALKINSIGCTLCRERYSVALKGYFSTAGDLCEHCAQRLHRNPFRILDCKDEKCRNASRDAPVITEFLCKECVDHFDLLKSYLDSLKISYIVDPRAVRGLDYYTKTVFEFVDTFSRGQNSVCGGGRYDNLTEQMGGPKLPALGFAVGMERLLLMMEQQNLEIQKPQDCDIYIANAAEEFKLTTMKLSFILRVFGKINCEYDISDKNLRSQVRHADKLGARFLLVIGQKEKDSGFGIVKNMKTKETLKVPLFPDDDFLKAARNIILAHLAQ